MNAIGSDQPITAELWNEFFGELDAKIVQIMDGKSLLLLPGRSAFSALNGWDPLTEVLGCPFFFTRQTPAYSYFLTGTLGDSLPYDHAPFTGAAEQLAVSLFDSPKKIVVLDAPVPSSFTDHVNMTAGASPGLFFDRSLEAHRKTFQEPGKDAASYWILERAFQANYRPEKIHRYAQAEIIIEGLGWENFAMDTRWNKYNFFRFHNLTGYAVTVHFAGYHSLVIPRWESRCVRRTSVTTGYLDGWNYFNRFRTGDPRVLQMPSDHTTPHGSMGANNVISPALVYRFLDILAGPYYSPVTGEVYSPRVYRDPHELYDVAALYPQFPAITDATVLGDLLHHAGELVSVKINGTTVTKTAFQFRSYGQLTEDCAAQSISVAMNTDGTITLGTTSGLTHDLWGTGTNLLGAPMGNLNTGITLGTACPASTVVVPGVVTSVPSVESWRTIRTIPDGTVALNGTLTASITILGAALSGAATGNSPNAIAIRSATVGQMKTLDPWGDPAYGGQDTTVTSFTGRAVTLTPFGLQLTFSFRVPIEHHPSWIGDFAYTNVLTGAGWIVLRIQTATIDLRNYTATVDGTAIKFQRAISFDGYGWSTRAAPAFIGPRKARVSTLCSQASIPYIVGDLDLDSDVWEHPSISNEHQGFNGEDFSVKPYTDGQKAGDTTGITRLTALAMLASAGGFSIYHDDVLTEFDRDPTLAGYLETRARYLVNQPATRRAIRLNLLREHFNCLVVTVNALKKCSPFTVEMWEQRFAPNTIGPYGGSICPANQYASFAVNSDAYYFWQALGVPIKRDTDLPASWATVRAAQERNLNLRTRYVETLHYDGLVGGLPQFTATIEIGETVPSLSPPEDGAPSLMVSEVFGVAGASYERFFWVTVEDVQAKAEELGFKFLLERQVIPYRLRLFYVEPAATEHLFSTPTNVQTFQTATLEAGQGANLNEMKTLYQTDLVPGAWALMTQCIEGESAEWIQEVTSVRLLDHRAGDIDTNLLSVSHSWDIPTLPNFSRISIQTSWVAVRHFGVDEYRLLRQRSDMPTDAHGSKASVLVQSWLSPGLTNSGTMILSRSPWIEFSTEEFSRESWEHAVGRLQFGSQVIALRAPASSAGASATALGGQGLITAPIDTTPAVTGDRIWANSTAVFANSTAIRANHVGTASTPGTTLPYAVDTLWVRDWPLVLG